MKQLCIDVKRSKSGRQCISFNKSRPSTIIALVSIKISFDLSDPLILFFSSLVSPAKLIASCRTFKIAIEKILLCGNYLNFKSTITVIIFTFKLTDLEEIQLQQEDATHHTSASVECQNKNSVIINIFRN